MTNIIEQLESEQMTRKIPSFGPGDTVIVQVKVEEGQRERLQAFEGIVIAVDLSNHRLGRKAEKIIKKLPAFRKFSWLGKSFKIKYVTKNKTHMIIFVVILEKINIINNNDAYTNIIKKL